MLTRGRTADQLRVLIENRKYVTKEEMMEKLDVFLMGNRISTVEYQELVNLLSEKEVNKE